MNLHFKIELQKSGIRNKDTQAQQVQRFTARTFKPVPFFPLPPENILTDLSLKYLEGRSAKKAKLQKNNKSI